MPPQSQKKRFRGAPADSKGPSGDLTPATFGAFSLVQLIWADVNQSVAKTGWTQVPSFCGNSNARINVGSVRFFLLGLGTKKKTNTWLGKELWNCNTDGYCPDVSLKVTSGSAQMPKRRLEQWSLACQPSHPAVTPAPSPSPDVNVILEARKGNVT